MLPETLGHYRIVRLLGRGGMGEVYLADDLTLGRQVALKILPPGLGTTGRERFEREARAVATLNHPVREGSPERSECGARRSHVGRSSAAEAGNRDRITGSALARDDGCERSGRADFGRSRRLAGDTRLLGRTNNSVAIRRMDAGAPDVERLGARGCRHVPRRPLHRVHTG